MVPGLLLAGGLSLYFTLFAHNYGTLKNFPKGYRRKAALNGLLPVLKPVFVVGSILLGLVTPTEAASFAVVHALFIGVCFTRTIQIKKTTKNLNACDDQQRSHYDDYCSRF